MSEETSEIVGTLYQVQVNYDKEHDYFGWSYGRLHGPFESRRRAEEYAVALAANPHVVHVRILAAGEE